MRLNSSHIFKYYVLVIVIKSISEKTVKCIGIITSQEYLSMHLKILSYNWHEPYLCLLSKIGHTFLIVEPQISEGNYRRWDTNMRPIPNNVILLSEEEAISQLDEGDVDLVIAHNIKDLVKIYEYSLPKIIVFHNKLSTEIELGGNKVDRLDYLNKLKPLLVNVKKVFISESKRNDWDMSGDVILPGIDVDDYGGYTGNKPSVLRVGNLMKERDLMMGFTTSEAILLNSPSTTLGQNPNILGARISSGFDDLLSHYRSLRVYLHTTSNDYEDGYNLSLLEAMAVGMPVISIANQTSPIIDGTNGYISNDVEYLKRGVTTLLEDKNLAISLGQRARETVREKFSQTKFLKLWLKSIETVIIDFLENSSKELPKENVLLKTEQEDTSMPQYYKHVRDDVLSLVPKSATDILEIGCAAGMTGRELKKNADIYFAGVEIDHKASLEAKKVLDYVIEGNIETLDLPFEEQRFDCILFADVLEHLIDPLTVLKKIRKFLKVNGTIIASIPNVQYLGVVNQLVEGNWTYQDEGILDRTHLRFFTYREIIKLFDEAGYKISTVSETLDPQYKNMKDQTAELNIGRIRIRDLSAEELKKFFVYQYKITANLKNEVHYKMESTMKDILEEGESLEIDGAYEDAIKTYTEAGIGNPDYAEILARIGNCYMKLQNIESAEKYYQKSLKVDTKGYIASVGIGLLEVQQNKLDDAVKRFSCIIKNFPESDKAYSGLGIAYSKMNKIVNAMDAFSKALTLNIENKMAMSSLLELSYGAKQFYQIEQAMKRYLEVHPSNEDILLGLAGLLYQSNRFIEAHDTLSLLLELNPNHIDAKIILIKIDENEKITSSINPINEITTEKPSNINIDQLAELIENEETLLVEFYDCFSKSYPSDMSKANSLVAEVLMDDKKEKVY
mgnify:FL=1